MQQRLDEPVEPPPCAPSPSLSPSSGGRLNSFIEQPSVRRSTHGAGVGKQARAEGGGPTAGEGGVSWRWGRAPPAYAACAAAAPSAGFSGGARRSLEQLFLTQRMVRPPFTNAAPQLVRCRSNRCPPPGLSARVTASSGDCDRWALDSGQRTAGCVLGQRAQGQRDRGLPAAHCAQHVPHMSHLRHVPPERTCRSYRTTNRAYRTRLYRTCRSYRTTYRRWTYRTTPRIALWGNSKN